MGEGMRKDNECSKILDLLRDGESFQRLLGVERWGQGLESLVSSHLPERLTNYVE